MKIALLTSLVPPDGEGGTERVSLAQARALAALGHEVLLLSGRPANARSDVEERIDGLAILRLAQDPSCPADPLGQRPLLLKRIETILAGFAPQRILVQSHWNLDPRIVARCALLCPTALFVHDFGPLCPRFFRTPGVEGKACPGAKEYACADLSACAACLRPLTKGLCDSRVRSLLGERLRLYREELLAADLLLFPSRTHLVRFDDLHPLRGRAKVLAPGLCQEFPGLAPPPQRYRGSGPLRILHHGRRSVEKGTLDLVRALAALPPGQVELFAPGGCEEGFDDLLRAAGPNLRAHYLGPYDAARLEELASACHLVALPSRLPESYSLAVDEGLALGLPVFASSADAALERHGPEALRVLPARDPAAWTAAIAEILSAPLLYEMHCSAIPEDVPSALSMGRALSDLLTQCGRQEGRWAA